MQNLQTAFSSWKWFYIGDIFDLHKGQRLTKADMQSGGTPFVGASERNNGVTTHIDVKPIFEANTMTVSYDGSIGEAFYQPVPYWALDSVNVLYPKFPLNPYSALFVAALIRKEKYRYNYGRKWHLERMRQSKIKLPVDGVGHPNWPGITQYMKGILSIEQKIQELAASRSKKRHAAFQLRNFRWFRLSDLFDLKKGKRLTKEDMRPGETPFIGSSELDNGVTGHIDQPPIHTGNTISVTYNGSVAEAFYQPRDFWASDDVNVLYPKFDLNPYIAMFLIAIIRKEKYRYNYGRKWHLERMRESKIKLPVDSKGNLDWKFMEEYIKSLPYSSGI